jgi:hypothetical protein
MVNMLRLRLLLVRIDYDQIAERLIPEALEGAMESESLSMRLAGKLLVKDGETSTLAKGVLKFIPQQAKSAFAYQLLLHNRERILEELNQLLMRELPGLLLSDLRVLDTVKGVYDMVKIEVSLKEIDYNSVSEQLLLKFLANMSQKSDQSGRLAQLLLSLGDAPGKMVTAALSVLPQETKDQLLVELFSLYQEETVERLNHMLEQQSLTVQVSRLKITKE